MSNANWPERSSKTKQQQICEEFCGDPEEARSACLSYFYMAAVMGGIYLLPLAAYWLGL